MTPGHVTCPINPTVSTPQLVSMQLDLFATSNSAFHLPGTFVLSATATRSRVFVLRRNSTNRLGIFGVAGSLSDYGLHGLHVGWVFLETTPLVTRDSTTRKRNGIFTHKQKLHFQQLHNGYEKKTNQHVQFIPVCPLALQKKNTTGLSSVSSSPSLAPFLEIFEGPPEFSALCPTYLSPRKTPVLCLSYVPLCSCSRPLPVQVPKDSDSANSAVFNGVTDGSAGDTSAASVASSSATSETSPAGMRCKESSACAARWPKME